MNKKIIVIALIVLLAVASVIYFYTNCDIWFDETRCGTPGNLWPDKITFAQFTDLCESTDGHMLIAACGPNCSGKGVSICNCDNFVDYEDVRKIGWNGCMIPV